MFNRVLCTTHQAEYTTTRTGFAVGGLVFPACHTACDSLICRHKQEAGGEARYAGWKLSRSDRARNRLRQTGYADRAIYDVVPAQRIHRLGLYPTPRVEFQGRAAT